MTAPIQPRPVVGPRISTLSRLKLTEPVRLYCYTLLTAVLVALVAVGWVTDEWSAALTGVAAAILGVVPGAEAARASVYSPAGHMADIVDLEDARVRAAQLLTRRDVV